tara:strand:+ start:994 stop:1215 length:222 start_codon:yes stop_codon:yes gene_type:complete
MDITVKVEDKSTTFVGDRDKILPQIQRYIYENRHLHVTVQNTGKDKITYEELFLNYGKNIRVQKEKNETKDKT